MKWREQVALALAGGLFICSGAAAWSEEKPHTEFATGFMLTGGVGVTSNNNATAITITSGGGAEPFHPAVPNEWLKPHEHRVVQTNSLNLPKKPL
jgi:hypothetical protein